MRRCPPFSAEVIAGALTTKRLGRPVIFFERVGSTNDVAHQQAFAGAAEGLLVVADEQTSGRGRLGRSWWAPKGSSLLFSILLRPALPAVRAGQLTMCLGLGTAEAIELVTGLRVALKWPNDLLLRGRKLGGLLAELRTIGDRVDYAVLGLGLNVNVEVEEATNFIPSERWISLSTALGRDANRAELLARILARSEAWYGRVAADEPIHLAWAARLDTLGRHVTVAGPAGQVYGRAVGVSPNGALILELEDGETREVWAGDVSTLSVSQRGG